MNTPAMSIAAGVNCIEHGQLADEATAKLMAEKGIWWSLQPFLDDEDLPHFPEGSENRKNLLQVVADTDSSYRLAEKYKVKKTHSARMLSLIQNCRRGKASSS